MVLRNMDKVMRGHHLVPEHVETRSLYCPDKPGVEQVHISSHVEAKIMRGIISEK